MTLRGLLIERAWRRLQAAEAHLHLSLRLAPRHRQAAW